MHKYIHYLNKAILSIIILILRVHASTAGPLRSDVSQEYEDVANSPRSQCDSLMISQINVIKQKGKLSLSLVRSQPLDLSDLGFIRPRLYTAQHSYVSRRRNARISRTA